MRSDSLKSLIYRHCPVCDQVKFRKLFEVSSDAMLKSLDIVIDKAFIVQCVTCKTHYTNPVLSGAVLESLYKSPVSGYNQAYPTTPDALPWEDQRVGLCEIQGQKHTGTYNVLDFGCGNGGFVYLCEQAGIDATGIDINPLAVSQALRLGVCNVTVKPIEDVAPTSYDVVTAIHIFEHLANCRAIAEQLSLILKPGGLAIVIVPNYHSMRFRINRKKYWNAPYEHMNGLSVKSLEWAFKDYFQRRLPLRGQYWKCKDFPPKRVRLSLLLTKYCGNILGFYPTKLVCVFER